MIPAEWQLRGHRRDAWVALLLASGALVFALVSSVEGIHLAERTRESGFSSSALWFTLSLLSVSAGGYVWMRHSLRLSRQVSDLAEQLHAFQLVVEAAPSLMCIQDGAGRVLAANPVARRVLAMNGAGYRGKTLTEILGYNEALRRVGGHLDDLAQAAWRDAEPVRGRVQVPRPDGTDLTLDVIAVPVGHPGGRGRLTAILGSDMTEQLGAERLLREFQERYLSLLMNNPDGILVTDTGGLILDANPAAEALTGRARGELVGRRLADLVRTYFRESQTVLAQICAGVSRYIETSWMHPEHGVLDLHLKVVPIHVANRLEGAFISLRNVTERNRVVAELRQSEARYRLLAEHMSDVVGSISPEGVVTYVSPSSMSVLGRPPAVYLGRVLFSFIHPQDAERVQQEFMRVVQDSSPLSTEFRYRTSRRVWGVLEMDFSPVVEDGRVQSVVAVAREVTARRQTEELLRRSDKLAAIGQLAAGVAHEIRNPLTSLKGFMQLIRQRVGREDHFEIMLSEMNRIEEIVNEFLTLSKPHAIQLRDRDVCAMLRSVVSLLDSQAHLSNVQIAIHENGNIPPVPCDEHQLRQVFLNIMKNAIEAMPHGGKLDVSVTASNDSVRITAVDDGEGMSPETLRRIGDPFFTTKERGTGLGMMITQKIVEAHRGTMTIESTVGAGTAVEIVLPIRRGLQS